MRAGFSEAGLQPLRGCSVEEMHAVLTHEVRARRLSWEGAESEGKR
jgi:hypothetical protein